MNFLTDPDFKNLPATAEKASKALYDITALGGSIADEAVRLKVHIREVVMPAWKFLQIRPTEVASEAFHDQLVALAADLRTLKAHTELAIEHLKSVRQLQPLGGGPTQ
jgi:hypothetical protein